ncbi:MAG: hypothetical protein ABR500_15900 [Dermatophilaceae bacterium]
MSAYAEAVVAGVADHVRALLFRSHWVHNEDIGNPDVLRGLLALPILHGRSLAAVHSESGYAVSISGGPLTTTGGGSSGSGAGSGATGAARSCPSSATARTPWDARPSATSAR